MPSSGSAAEGFAHVASDPIVFIKMNFSGAWNYSIPAQTRVQNTDQESIICCVFTFPGPHGYP